MSRVRSPLPALALALALAAPSVGCMGHAPPPRVARLRVEAVPPETTVYIDGEFVGTARVLTKKAKHLRPGVKYITFRAPGYFPHDVRHELPAGLTTLRIKLRPIPP